jgi:4-hydroxybenzoate polyprenyltransferase/phosphoserine phosphatase
MTSQISAAEVADVPLCVDLDGTLLRSDSLWESLLLLVRDKPTTLWRLPAWLMSGKARFKEQVARHAVPDASVLPYREDMVERIRAERSAGRRIFLCTAADQRIATAVAKHLGCFDGVAASNGSVNVSGTEKVNAIRAMIGTGPFDYLGDGPSDLPVFRAARRVTVVDPSRMLEARLQGLSAVDRIRTPDTRWRAIVKALRVQQWAKNFLVFVPLFLAHQTTNPELLRRALWSFAAFCLGASAIYIINDLLDIESDRRHPRKRRRPFAAGTLPIPWGMALAPVMLLGAAAIATFALPPMFGALLATYIVATVAYSVHFKRRGVVDVLILAGLYTLRLLAGAVATGVEFSVWLGAFSMFLFLSLAFVKRYTELLLMEGSRDEWFHGRGYNRGDLEIIRGMGPASGYLAVLVLTLYLNSDTVSQLYRRPAALWLIAPLLLYWITRVWLRAHRGQILDDPIIATMKDKVSYLVALMVVAVLVVATG